MSSSASRGRIQRILAHAVVETSLEAPKSFTLTFDDGHSLTIYDDSDQYESFSIQPGNVFVSSARRWAMPREKG